MFDFRNNIFRFHARGAHGLKCNRSMMQLCYGAFMLCYSLEHIGLMLWVTFGTPVALVMTLGLSSQPCLICSLLLAKGSSLAAAGMNQ